MAKLEELKNTVTAQLTTATNNDKKINLSVPTLLTMAITSFVTYVSTIEGVEVVTPMLDGQGVLTNAGEYGAYCMVRDASDAKFDEITSALTIEDANATGGLTSGTAIKLIENLLKLVQNKTKRALIVECFNSDDFISYRKESMASYKAVFGLIEKIIKPTKIDESVATKSDVWYPRHLHTSADLSKITLQLDESKSADNLDADYIKRLKNWNDKKIGVSSPYKIVDGVLKDALKAKAKEDGVDKLEGEVARLTTIKALKGLIERFEAEASKSAPEA